MLGSEGNSTPLRTVAAIDNTVHQALWRDPRYRKTSLPAQHPLHSTSYSQQISNEPPTRKLSLQQQQQIRSQQAMHYKKPNHIPNNPNLSIQQPVSGKSLQQKSQKGPTSPIVPPANLFPSSKRQLSPPSQAAVIERTVPNPTLPPPPTCPPPPAGALLSVTTV